MSHIRSTAIIFDEINIGAGERSRDDDDGLELQLIYNIYLCVRCVKFNLVLELVCDADAGGGMDTWRRHIENIRGSQLIGPLSFALSVQSNHHKSVNGLCQAPHAVFGCACEHKGVTV